MSVSRKTIMEIRKKKPGVQHIQGNRKQFNHPRRSPPARRIKNTNKKLSSSCLVNIVHITVSLTIQLCS